MRGPSLRRWAALLERIASPALAFSLLLVPFGVALGLVVLRFGVVLLYGGGIEAFDRHYEARVQEEVARVETPAEAVRLVAQRWDPVSLWQREILGSDDAPEELCLAESAVREDGVVGLLIGCGGIEGFAADGALPEGRRHLSDDAHDRALWLTARGLRLIANRMPDRGIIAVHQSQSLGVDDVAVYSTWLEFSKRDGVDVLLAELAQRIQVTTKSASGRRRPIMER